MKDKPAIVIPLDGSKTATAALGAAQVVANLMAGVLHIVHATETPLSEDQLLKTLNIDSLQVECFVLHQIGGDAVDAILKFALNIDARMIVMSSHGHTYNPQHVVGGTAIGIIQHAAMPVMVIRPGIQKLPDVSWTPARMLLPLEGAPEVAAIEQIFSLAKLIEVDVDVLHIVFVGAEQPSEAGALTSPKYIDYPQYDWLAWAEEFINRFGAHRPLEVKLRLFHREGRPADVMLGFALENNEDLIALSWHGHLEKERAAVVKGILQRTELPILLMRSEE